MLTDEEIIKISADTKTGEPGLHGYILPISFAREIERAVLAKAGAQKADLYIVYNGVCISGIYYDDESAKAYADSKQKEHSLSGSIASFHVKEMYCHPLPAQAIPDPINLDNYDYDPEYISGWNQCLKAMLSTPPKP